MKLLLGSGGYRSPERRALLVSEMRAHFGDISKILFVPYALADHDGYVRKMTEAGFDAGYELDGVHRYEDPVAAVGDAEAIYVGGGNTFRLTAQLWDKGLIEPIRAAVRGGVPFMGVSAGTNVACPTMQTTNDMPITMPRSFETFGFVPFQVNTHYYPGQVWIRHADEFEEHFGETREDRIREFHEMNDTPVVGMWEATNLRVDDDQVTLVGGRARVFRKGREPYDVGPGPLAVG